jgi:hypothetical protein
MSKIYISYSKIDESYALQFAEALRKVGHEILIDREFLQPGMAWQQSLSGSLKSADVFLVLITQNSMSSQYVMGEIGAARAYINSFPDQKLLIPVVSEDTEIPSVIQDIQCIRFNPSSPLDKTIDTINQAITYLLGRQVAVEQKREERKQQIEISASMYIEDTLKDLRSRETSLRSSAERWNNIGWGSLWIGVFAAVGLLIYGLNNPAATPKEWPSTAFLGIKSVIIVALLIASSKYAFSLAKAYMCESLKNSDRIHAISFGNFFLQAFGESVDSSEVKEVFQNWNIGGSSAFSSLESKDFDPKMIEAIVSIADVVRRGEGKGKKT